MTTPHVRQDHHIIAQWIQPQSRVIDIGCANGEFLKYLKKSKKVNARGLELSNDGVNICVAQGLSVMQGNADTDLQDYPNQAFDYAVLSQTLQAVERPKIVLEHMLRIAHQAIVSFPNFAHWRARRDLSLYGSMPQNNNLPVMWYETPNIHFCTIKDFLALTKKMNLIIEDACVLYENKKIIPFPYHSWFCNIMGNQAIFKLKKKL